MKQKFLLGLAFLTGSLFGATDVHHYTDIGNIALTVSNYGMLGNGFRVYVGGEPLPSGEYPRGSGTEHLYRAGLWVGAITAMGDTLVTTGVVDATGAQAGYEGFEFYPTPDPGDTVIERSKLLTSRYYDPQAVSEQDFLAEYYDYLNTTVPHHTPLGLKVKQRSYAWSYPYADDFVIISFTIINERSDMTDLFDVYIGLYAELVSGNREFWGSDFNTTEFFQHKRLYYDDTLRMVYEHNDGTDTLARSIAGFKILGLEVNGEPVDLDTMTISFNWWGWMEMGGSVDDTIRYNLMSNGERDPNVDEAYIREHSGFYPDPIPLISIGPIPHLAYGDSITFVVAFVGGEMRTVGGFADVAHLFTNASWAQRAYDAHYILPEPPPSPRLVVIPGDRQVTLYWDNHPESVPDPNTGQIDFEGYRVYRREFDDTSWTMIAQFDIVDSIGFNVGLPSTEDTGEYAGWYKFVDTNLKNGFAYTYAVTSYDRGDPQLELESLESSQRVNETTVVPGTPPNTGLICWVRVHPNGYRERICKMQPLSQVRVYPNPYKLGSVWDKPGAFGRVIRFYNLPKRCRIYIYNLAGDLVKTIEHDDPLTGEATWNLITDKDQEIATGLYIFVVKDLDTGKIQRGRFLVIK